VKLVRKVIGHYVQLGEDLVQGSISSPAGLGVLPESGHPDRPLRLRKKLVMGSLCAPSPAPGQADQRFCAQPSSRQRQKGCPAGSFSLLAALCSGIHRHDDP
jgi:hypothetical protein